MLRKVLIYIGGGMTIAWGIAHLIPVAGVVAGFGPISLDNARVITMEWINEGLTLIFLGTLAIVTAIVEEKSREAARMVYFMVFVMLAAMSVLSVFTGFKVSFLPYKLCPFIFTIAGLLVLQGIMRPELALYRSFHSGTGLVEGQGIRQVKTKKLKGKR